MSESSYVVKLEPQQAKGLRPILSQISIELTERCNNACIHCLINQPENDTNIYIREMDTAFVKDILQQAANLGCLTVRLTGGEPLLRSDFSELYLFARRLGLYVILYTNARLITVEVAQLLAKIPPGRVVEVTVYGMHPKSYEAVTNSRGSFADFWHGVKLLKDYQIPFIVKQSVLPPNRNELAEFESFAATLPQMNNLPGYTMNFNLRARRDNPVKNEFIKTLRLSPGETIKYFSRNNNYRDGMRQFVGKFIGPPGEKLFNCGAGQGVCIDAYGKAQMCLLLRHPDTVFELKKIHSAHENKPDEENMSLKYALSTFFPHIREMKATNLDYLDRCAKCFLKGLCEQCPAKSWMEHGTLDTPVDYLCQVAHAEARYLGLIGKNENAWEVNPDNWKKRIRDFSFPDNK